MMVHVPFAGPNKINAVQLSPTDKWDLNKCTHQLSGGFNYGPGWNIFVGPWADLKATMGNLDNLYNLYIMRWSLVVFTCLVLQSTLTFFSFALALPTTRKESDLVARARTAKYSSAKYRKIAEGHEKDYHVKGGKLVIKPAPAVRTAKALAEMRKKDADHILEHQVLNKALKNQGKKFSDLAPHTQEKVKGVFNHANNLAYVHKSVNRSVELKQKAGVIKAALNGNKSKSKNPARDQYIKKTFQHAQQTAKKIDKILKTDGHKGNVHRTLRIAAKHAGIKR
ncbi:unnamed protein product [Cyclocybe aegerita]|uniref:Uncharacterized protein n=1 Tax=Cyclocybe aegerita TaxID=1973307 RepID=A0A8S0WKF0_CYCAE|nr:unnamed protein product [Cyclocybe aegerita]